MDLADTFGVFTALFTREQHIRRAEWQDGAFRMRNNDLQRMLCLTVITADNAVGQAWSEDWSLAAVQRCFHVARNNARQDPLRLASIQEMAREEKRFPAMSKAGSEAPETESLPREVERLHQQAAARIAPYSLTTTLENVLEQMRVVRSDGISYAVCFSRLLTDHVTYLPAGNALHRIRIGTSHLPQNGWDVQHHLAALSEQTERFIRDFPTLSDLEHSAYCTHAPLTDCPLLLDIELLARLVYAWVQSSRTTIGSRAIIQAVALDGCPGYFPLHPWGCLFPPLTLLSPTGPEPAHLHAVRGISSFSNHLLVRLPDSLEQVQHVDHLFEQAGLMGMDGTWLLLEGVDWFAFDGNSGLCSFLPRSMRTRHEILKPCLFELPLHRVMESLWPEPVKPSSGGDLKTSCGLFQVLNMCWFSR